MLSTEIRVSAVIFFSIRIFFYEHWRLTGQQGNRGNHLLFHSTTSTRSRTFRHLFATLHVRWLSYIFNSTACIYQTATRWDLPPYRIAIWLINDVILIFACFLDDLVLGFGYSNLIRETRGLELTPTIILVLQANRLTKCASHVSGIEIMFSYYLNPSVGGGILPPSPLPPPPPFPMTHCWFSLNNSETVKVVNLEFCSIK